LVQSTFKMAENEWSPFAIIIINVSHAITSSSARPTADIARDA